MRLPTKILDVVVPRLAHAEALVAPRLERVGIAHLDIVRHRKKKRKIAADEGFDLHLAVCVGAASPNNQAAIPVGISFLARCIRKDAQAGAIRAFNAYREQGEDAASAVEKAFTDAMGATEDAIVNLVMSGGDGLKSLADLANSVVAEITRMAVKQAITGPLFSAIGGSMGGGGGGFLDSIFGMLFHEGGTVGEGLPKRRAVPAHVFIGAPRYHGGGIAGLKPGEIPAILERGETVLPKNQRMGAASTVIMNISTPDANSFRSSQAQIAADAARGIDRARRNL